MIVQKIKKLDVQKYIFINSYVKIYRIDASSVRKRQASAFAVHGYRRSMSDEHFENFRSGRAPNDEKSLRKVPQCVYKENAVGGRPQAPSNDEKSLEKSLQWRPYGRPPWVKWRPPNPPPSRFSKYAAGCNNTSPTHTCLR